MPLLTPNPMFSATCCGLKEQGWDWHMLSGIFAFPLSTRKEGDGAGEGERGSQRGEGASLKVPSKS